MAQRNPYQRAGSLAELLSWHDEDFVRCAYVTLLGRQPDSIGEWHYVEQVRAGQSRYKILWELRRSQEGKRHDPGIAGLDRSLRKAARERLPLIGSVMRLFDSNADCNNRSAREHRALVNASTLERYTLYSGVIKLGGIEWLLSQHLQAWSQPPSSIRQSLSDMPAEEQAFSRRIAHLTPKSALVRFFAAETN
jgi:hypothetical protein